VLVDDHELIRQGLRHAFEAQADFEVVGEASGVQEGGRIVSELQPDVVVLDVRLPDGSGLDLARALRAVNPNLGIVILTMYAGDEQLFGALDAGASAFVAKDAPADDVVAAARHAAATPTGFAAATLADAMRRRMDPAGPRLSPREQQVLDLLADGLPISGIARRLFISESTAKTHISKLYEKLGAGNRAQVLMAALRHGLIQSPEREAP
jgi:DNA-binding NarL/FixJ family response regulator